jgi:hypothetical protein
MKRPTNIRIPKVDVQEFEMLREFQYFGYYLTEDNSITIEIK